MAKKKKNRRKILWILLVVLTVSSAAFGYLGYSYVYKPNVDLGEKDFDYLYIPTGSDFESVKKELYSKGWIRNHTSFEWVAARKKYSGKVKAGRYKVVDGMSNNELINMLRSGKQEPVKFQIKNVRFKEEIVSVAARTLEADSAGITDLLNDREQMKKYGLTPENALALFLPNTYEINWNTSPAQFIERMGKEFNAFWEGKRKNRAKEIGLTIPEVVTLASILDQESGKADEKPRIAGVYVNRLRKGMLLQADPTVKYALRDFGIRRLLNKHLTVDSPYNTYMYKGLPPGPIYLPLISSLDAVLQFEEHEYLYFCAKPDFSGYHNFSKSFEQHQEFAHLYQKELDRRKIMK